MSTLSQSAFSQDNSGGAVAVDLIEAARLLTVSTKTIRREINRGKLKALRIGRVWRVRIAEINSYAKRLEAINS